jgi:hypothetical protein
MGGSRGLEASTSCGDAEGIIHLKALAFLPPNAEGNMIREVELGKVVR